MNLPEARTLAEAVVAALAPFSERIEIAGSIRRGRPQVNDIDLVILPRDRERLLARCKQKCTVLAEGEWNVLLRMPSGADLDIFFARPEGKTLFENEPTNFGSLLVCRTGSKEHNIWLCQVAQRRRLSWNPYWGVFDGPRCLACAEEADIFQALSIPYVKPENRER